MRQCNLTDGAYLPCVVFQSKRKRLELALHRFEELRKHQDQYERVVEAFAASGSRVNSYDISTVEPSRFAWPLGTLKQIHGETVMSWTAFVVEMKDGRRFSYGTSFRFGFFARGPPLNESLSSYQTMTSFWPARR